MTSKSKQSECVKVVVRCRPLNQKEIQENHESVVEMDLKLGQVLVKNPKSASEPTKSFTFDAIYNWNSTQSDIFEETFLTLLESVLNGFNGTIFAYGQTGTGKTFTMEGVRSDPDLRGAIPRSFEHIYKHIARTVDQQFLVRASYLEIYQEEVRDLLSKDQTKRLELKERPDTGVYVKDLLSFVTKSVKEIEHVMNVGNQNRSVGSTNMNEHSSRSHAIFVITIECSEDGVDGKNHIRVGKLNLVDLAGSERQAKSGATGKRLKEATKINLSLAALGNVISSLVDGKGHIPYRDSKLTRLLQDSLGGNAKTVMVANIGPASYNYDETLTTLRYANRAKNIQNKPKINEDPKDALLREFQEEIAKLKAHLDTKGTKDKKKKHRRRREGAEGEESWDEESGTDEDDDGNLSEEHRLKLEADKERILQDKTMAEEEKSHLLKEKEEKLKELEEQKKAKKTLAAKIEAMQSKLLVGGKTIIDHTNQQEREIEARRRQLAEQTRKEREMKQKLLKKEETALEAQEHYTSLRQEVEAKTLKLKKLYAKMRQAESEIKDLSDIHASEREELELVQLEMSRELKLKTLIIENFIPVEERNKLEKRIYCEDDDETYKIRPLSNAPNQTMMKRPQSAHSGNQRAVSQYARMAATIDYNPRYRCENIVLLDLDMPTRTTSDYHGPAIAPRVQAALDAALQDEDDIQLDASSEQFTKKAKPRKKSARTKAKSSKKGDGSSTRDSAEMYPSSRGLVPK
uniref:Kinesin-like protein n=1 Tax=Phallusia mammillata TaxID=59560 RepID=A0A6F9DFV6_9ASCI|nr:kinesin family member 3B [Phallusia mammillata]